MNRTINAIHPLYSCNITCQGTILEAIVVFLDSDSYEDAVRNATSLGGDSYTVACLTSGIAEVFYGGVPQDVRDKPKEYLTPELWQTTVAFCRKFR